MVRQMVVAHVIILSDSNSFYYLGRIYGYKEKILRLDVIGLKYADHLSCEYASTLYIVTVKEPSPHSLSICSCQSVS